MTDKIFVKNLQLPFGIIAQDVWSKPKEQPGIVSITLMLASGFNTAADMDKLDASTIHYGELSKRVRASCKANQDVNQVILNTQKVVDEMGTKGVDNFIVSQSVIELHLPTASMFGEGMSICQTVDYNQTGQIVEIHRVFKLHNVKIMTLVGVNSYERSARQPLIAQLDVEVDCDNAGARLFLTQMQACCKLEQSMVQIIEATSFETLESLAEHTYQRIRASILDEGLTGSLVRLKLEKPRAIAFASAPAVEILRAVPAQSGHLTLAETLEQFDVVKPYV